MKIADENKMMQGEAKKPKIPYGYKFREGDFVTWGGLPGIVLHEANCPPELLEERGINQVVYKRRQDGREFLVHEQSLCDITAEGLVAFFPKKTIGQRRQIVQKQVHRKRLTS